MAEAKNKIYLLILLPYIFVLSQLFMIFLLYLSSTKFELSNKEAEDRSQVRLEIFKYTMRNVCTKQAPKFFLRLADLNEKNLLPKISLHPRAATCFIV